MTSMIIISITIIIITGNIISNHTSIVLLGCNFRAAVGWLYGKKTLDWKVVFSRVLKTVSERLETVWG